VPSNGYSTIGLKPSIVTRLQRATDEYYPGMFIPSTLIIMMNEIKRGYYSVGLHNVRPDFSGQYTSLTLRSDVKSWLQKNYVELQEEYDKEYGTNCFTRFTCVFILNMLESKAGMQNNVLKLRESNFVWLMDKYIERRRQYPHQLTAQTFEQFADVFLKEILEKMDAAKKILSI
jgi:tRNA(Met) C34 N-acetyltransferase TmcA